MSKRERKNAPGFSNFGFSTILLAFVMICIVTIAALSLLTANSDYKLSQKVAEKNSAYYVAEKQAYETLSTIDSLLANAYHNASDANVYYKEVETSLLALENGNYDRTTGSYTYMVSIAENQNLKVTILIHYPSQAGECFYEVATWQSVYEEVEIDEGTLDLID